MNYNDLTTLGTFQASKTMTLNPSGIGLFGALGNATSNQLRFYGGTSLKEIICMFRDSDDAGLTIASKAQTIQKCSPLLQLYSGYDTSGVVGTSSAEYKEVIRSNHKLVGLSDNYQSGWFHGYLLGTPPWLSSGFGYLTQFYTSMPVLNIAWNTSTTSSYASGSNLLLTSNQIVFGSATPQSGYCLSLYPTTNKGIWMNSVGGAAIYVKTQFGGTTGRSSLDFEDDAGNVYEYGIRGSSDSPSGWYWYVSGGYRMCLLRSFGNLGIGTTGPSAKLQVNGSNTIAIFSDGTCNCDIWCNTGGLLCRQVFFGPSTNDALTFQTNNSPRMQIQSNGNVTIGNGPGYYPLHILNSVTGDASYNYYYYKGPGSSNGSTTNTPSSVSMKSEVRLLVTGEVDVISDYRKKKDIEVLSRDYCVDFARKIDPKRFVYKYEDCGLQFGYIAQDLMKNNFGELIMVSENDKMEEHVDEDGFVSEKDKLYTLTRSQVIPILHGAIKDLYDKIDMLESKLKSQTISRDETCDASDTSSSDLHEIVTSRGRKIKIKASSKDAN